jgi:hypothetical protein
MYETLISKNIKFVCKTLMKLTPCLLLLLFLQPRVLINAQIEIHFCTSRKNLHKLVRYLTAKLELCSRNLKVNEFPFKITFGVI